VAQNSHIRISLTPKVRPLTIYPQFDPKHVAKAVAMLWGWVEGTDGHAGIEQGDYPQIVLTSEKIMRNLITDPSSASSPTLTEFGQSNEDRPLSRGTP